MWKDICDERLAVYVFLSIYCLLHELCPQNATRNETKFPRKMFQHIITLELMLLPFWASYTIVASITFLRTCLDKKSVSLYTEKLSVCEFLVLLFPSYHCETCERNLFSHILKNKEKESLKLCRESGRDLCRTTEWQSYPFCDRFVPFTLPIPSSIRELWWTLLNSRVRFVDVDVGANKKKGFSLPFLMCNEMILNEKDFSGG